jgi:hypothetical protein
MKLRLFQRREIWVPTLLGWAGLILVGIGTPALWWFEGESYLSLTERQPADVLVVEGWIGDLGVNAAAIEFRQGGYHYVVTTSGLTGTIWTQRRWSYAIIAQQQMLRLGIDPGKIIVATPVETENHRTYESAVTVFHALQARGIAASTLNVFTEGDHARRSRLVFSKVFGRNTKVGVIAWIPPDYATTSWWQSSNRASDFIKESVGYLFEALLSSGRGFHAH